MNPQYSQTEPHPVPKPVRFQLDNALEEFQRGLRDPLFKESTRLITVQHNPDAPEGADLIQLARKNPVARRCIVELAKAGFYACAKGGNETKFVRSDHIAKMWHRVRKQEYRLSPHEVLHSLTLPLDGRTPKRLLVVFSSIQIVPGLKRYFTQNFQTVQKYIPADSAVLRIGDLGGIIGSFYMNTAHRPQNALSVQKLIRRIWKKLEIPRDSVLLYGASKGGSGALYHGLTGGYRFVAVDPVVTDTYYEEHLNDAHFTRGGIFLERKEVAFQNLFQKIEENPPRLPISSRSSVICSERSPQFPYIEETLIKRFEDRIAFFNTLNPQIHNHPDVSKCSLNIATMLMNTLLYGMDVPPGVRNVD